MFIDASVFYYLVGPSSSEIKSENSLTNPTSDLIAFKLMCSSPNRYLVSPKSGKLSRNETVRLTGNS